MARSLPKDRYLKANGTLPHSLDWGPTLIVRGEDSNILGHGVLARMLEVMPAATPVEIAGAGHGVPQDQPQAFWSRVNAFLQESAEKREPAKKKVRSA